MSEKILNHDRKASAGDLSAEGALSAMPPAFSPTAGPSDPNLGGAAQLKGDNKTDRQNTKTPLRLKSITVPAVPQELVDSLVQNEGVRTKVYLDSKGIPTVGLGHKLKGDEKKKWKVGDALTIEEISAFAKQDIGASLDAARSQMAKLNLNSENFLIALAEVNFQLGHYWYTIHKKTWGYMLDGNWEHAASEAAMSKWNSETPKRVVNFQNALCALPVRDSENGNPMWPELKASAIAATNAPHKESNHTHSKPNPVKATAKAVTGKEQVKKAQTKLKKLGLYSSAIDGIQFRRDGKESNTTKAIKAFQKLQGVAETGELDQETYAALISGEKLGAVGGLFRKPLSEVSKGAKKKDNEAGFLAEFRTNWDEIMGGPDQDKANFEAKELDVLKYWKTQDSGQCDKAAKRIITKHKKNNPELYEDFGSIGSSLTARENSLHLNWEKDWQKGTSRKQGEKNANVTSTLEIDNDEWESAIRYVTACLDAGVPVMVGVNHTFAYKGAAANNDKTTDHWLTVVGKGKDKKGSYLSYMDVGTTRPSAGKDTSLNRLYQTENKHIWRDDTKYTNADSGKGSYTLVAVSLYDKHRGKKEFKVGSQTFNR